MVNLSVDVRATEHPERRAAALDHAGEPPPEFAKSAADVRLAAAVREALQNSGHRPVAEVRVFVNDGVVVLRGVVSLYYVKQLAQAAVLRLEQVQSLRNEIVVVR